MLKWSADDRFLIASRQLNEVGRMTTPDGRLISRGLRIQSLASLLLSGSLLLIGPVAAYSSIFGSLAAFIPALFFTFFMTSKFGPDSAAFLRAAVIAEAGKILLTAVVCVVVFVWVKPLAAGWFFTGMLVTIFSGWLGMLLKA
jgi:F0F1-type ATP synthase assembly protein I